MKRNISYDLIRLLGLLVIMVAHSSPPGWLFQLRNFGTPLLVMGSAITYALIFSSVSLDVRRFYFKRVSRILFPVWIFLTLFFLVCGLILDDYPFKVNQIVESYLLLDGIGFVWVFKIYLILALVTPLAVYLNKSRIRNKAYFSCLALMYFVYEVINFILSGNLTGWVEVLVNDVLFIAIPYTLLYLYSFRLYMLSRRLVLGLSFGSFILFLCMLLYMYSSLGVFVHTQEYKYPPTIYYLSYSFFAINIVYLVLTGFIIKKQDFIRLVVWLSSNSMWIYLWHILAFYIWKFCLPEPSGDLVWFSLKTIFLLSFGALMAHLQNYIVDKIPSNNVFWLKKVRPLLSGMYR